MTVLAVAVLISVGVSLFIVTSLVVMCVVIAILDAVDCYAGGKRVARIMASAQKAIEARRDR
jgi:hypothetical protein